MPCQKNEIALMVFRVHNPFRELRDWRREMIFFWIAMFVMAHLFDKALRETRKLNPIFITSQPCSQVRAGLFHFWRD